jgi:hypothetical protein
LRGREADEIEQAAQLSQSRQDVNQHPGIIGRQSEPSSCLSPCYDIDCRYYNPPDLIGRVQAEQIELDATGAPPMRCSPLWTADIPSSGDFASAAVVFLWLFMWRAPSRIVNTLKLHMSVRAQTAEANASTSTVPQINTPQEQILKCTLQIRCWSLYSK